MIYEAELYYFKSPDFPFEKAVRVTATTISKWATQYEAMLITPKKGVGEKSKKGHLIDQNKSTEITEALNWIFENSDQPDLFCLFLDDASGETLFDHHDDTCCWALRLEEEQFRELQKAWKAEGLPEDLFYPEEASIRQGNYYYTPKQWEAKEK